MIYEIKKNISHSRELSQDSMFMSILASEAQQGLAS